MNRRFRFLACVMVVSLLVIGCQSTMSNFIDDMYKGKEQLTLGQYPTALAFFLDANKQKSSAGALAFAGMTAYKMGDVYLADRYLIEARAQNAEGVVTCIVFGYQALVRFSMSDHAAGLQALNAYIVAYKSLRPESVSIADVELMAVSGRVDLVWLQKTIDQQIQELPIDYDKM